LDDKFISIASNFKENEKLWKTLTDCEYPLREVFPFQDAPNSINSAIKGTDVETESEFGTFAKLCIIKVMRPEKITQSIRDFVLEMMGEPFLNPPPFDLEHSFDDSTYQTPLIFVLPGSDPLKSLTTFAHSKKKLDTLKSISLG
jgi:hypothetical protein